MSALLGVATAVGIAWASAAFTDVGRRGTVHTNFGFGVAPDPAWRGYTLHTLSGMGFVRRMRTPNQPSMFVGSQPFRPMTAMFANALPALGMGDPPSSGLVGEWGALRIVPDPAELSRIELEDARGWPWLCLHAQFEATGDGWRPIGGVTLNSGQATDELSIRILPMLPIWRGLLLSSLCYSLVWGVPLVGVPTFRAWLRGRSGRCRACGYDLRGSDGRCPECGETSSRIA